MQTVLNLRLHQCHYLGHVTSIRSLTASKLKEYYDLLKVNRNSSPKEIKESFLRLSKQYHPDNKVTGSHNKFVNLKQAYDAIKDGPPATTPGPATQYPRYTAAREDLSHKAYTEYRERYQYHMHEEARRRAGYGGFGGPHSGSSTPWEDMLKERQRRQDNYNRGEKIFIGYTRYVVIVSLLFYIFLFGGLRALVESNDNHRRKVNMVRVRSQEDFELYSRYLRERSEERKRQIQKAAVKRSQRHTSKEDEDRGKNKHTTQEEEIHDPADLNVEFTR